jgi:hypothetical protein
MVLYIKSQNNNKVFDVGEGKVSLQLLLPAVVAEYETAADEDEETPRKLL